MGAGGACDFRWTMKWEQEWFGSHLGGNFKSQCVLDLFLFPWHDGHNAPESSYSISRILHLGYDGKVDMQHEWEINIHEAPPSTAPNCTKNDIQTPCHMNRFQYNQLLCAYPTSSWACPSHSLYSTHMGLLTIFGTCQILEQYMSCQFDFSFYPFMQCSLYGSLRNL